MRNEGDLASSIQGALDLLQINETNSLDDNKYVVAPLAKILKGLDDRIHALLHEIKQAQSKNDAAVALADTLQQCWRRLNIDHLCRLNFDQGLLLAA